MLSAAHAKPMNDCHGLRVGKISRRFQVRDPSRPLTRVMLAPGVRKPQRIGEVFHALLYCRLAQVVPQEFVTWPEFW
jgi:hypothetical protein